MNHAYNKIFTLFQKINSCLDSLRFVYFLIGCVLFSVPSLAQPTLNTPANTTIELSQNVNFNWNPRGSAESRIQVAASTAPFTNAAGFTNPIHNQNSGSNTSVSLFLEGGKAYAWAVKGLTLGYSNRYYFLVRQPPAVLLLPEDRATVSRNINFSWKTVTNSDQYRLQISTSPNTNAGINDFTNPDIYDQNIDNRLSISLSLPNLRAGTTYYWHVRGGNSIVGGIYSQTWSFRLPPDCSGLSTSVSTTPDNGTDNGTARATVNGGSAPYSYNWSNGESNASLNNLTAARYCVTVTDVNGCTANACGEVALQLPPLGINADVTPATCGANGKITVNATGGSGGGYQIRWTDGSDGIFDRTDLATGNYSFTVTDAHTQISPVSRTAFVANQNQAPTVNIQQTTDPTTNRPTELFTNPDNFTDYKWFDNGVEVGSEARLALTNLSVGTHLFKVIVTDNCEQKGRSEINVTIQALRLVGIAQTTAATCPRNGEINIDMTDAPADVTFLWNDRQTVNPRTDLAAGTYAVTVSAPNYTPLVLSQIVVANGYSPLAFAIAQQNGATANERVLSTNPANLGATDWRIGSATSTILSSDDVFTHEFPVGTHTVYATITDACGEILTKTVSITINATTSELVVNPTITPETCRENGIGNGAINLQISGGSGQNTVRWASSASTSSNLTGLLAGTYRYTVTDATPSVSPVSGEAIVTDERLTPTFQVQSVQGTQARTYTFSATPNTDLSNFIWTINGAIVNTTASFLHTFPADGSYTVKLIATHRCGQTIDNQIVVAVSTSGGGVSTTHSLVCRNPEGVPNHSAIFDFQTGSSVGGKISFGDGQEQNVATQTGRLNHTFQYAGVYYAVLFVNNLPVDTATVIISTSCNWRSFVGGVGFSGVPTPPHCENIRDGIFHVLPSRIAYNYFWTTLHRTQHFGVNGDNATVEIRAKNAANEGGISCYDLSLGISGTKSGAHVSLMTSWCSFYANLSAGRTARSQVAELARDLEAWHIYKMQTENHILKIFYDGALIYSMPYEGEIGEIVDISTSFKGTGSVDYIELKENGAAVPMLREDFTTCQNTQRALVTVNQAQTICSGQSVRFNNRNLNQTGIYRDTMSGLGCEDTTHILNLTVLPKVKTIQNLTIRAGDSLVLNGKTRRISGIFTDTLRTATGCDSLVETHLTVIICNLTVQIQRNGNTLRAVVPNAPPQYQTTWTRPNGSTATSTALDITASGLYKIKITDTLGCEATAQISVQIEGYSVGRDTLKCGVSSLWLPVILKKNDNDLAGLITSLRFDSTQFVPTGRTRLARITDNCLIINSINNNKINYLLYLNRLNPITGTIGDTLFSIEVKPVSSFLRQNATATMAWSIEEDHFTALSESFTGSTTVQVEGTTAAAFSLLFNGTTELRRDLNKPVIYFGETCNSFNDTLLLDVARKGLKLSPMPFYQIKQHLCDPLNRLIETSEDVYLAAQIALASRSFIPTCYQMWAADADCNGKISPKDISLLQQRLIGLMESGFLMPDGSHKTRFFFPKKMMTQQNWHVSTRYPDADTEGGMTRLNVSILNNNCFKLDSMTRCDTLNEAIADIRIGDLDGSTTAVMLRSSGTLIADFCGRKRSGDTLFIPVMTPQYATSFDVFVEGQTPFSGVQEVENGIMKVRANTTNATFNISGYSSVSGGIAAKQPLFYLTLPFKGDAPMPKFTTNNVLLNGQTATFKVVNDACLTTKKAPIQSLSVYPNPTTDIMTLNYPTGFKGDVSLIDVVGRQIATWKTDGNGLMTLDVSNFAAGIYVLKLSNGMLQKMVKQ